MRDAKAESTLYLSIVTHNEEPGHGSHHPDYLEREDFYFENRELLRQFVLMLASKGAMLNFQSDWNYLKAVARYDRGDVVSNSSGKNIVRWLVEDIGFEADPHAHETEYNYADVAYLHTELGVEPSKNVGGFLSDPPDNVQGWEQHADGVHGRKYPSYFWRANLLWGAGVLQHRGEEAQSNYGVWKPKDRYNLLVHDPAQRLVYIGSGCADNNPGGFGGGWKILDAISKGTVPGAGFYTATVFVPQAALNRDLISGIEADIDSIADYMVQGRVVWSSLTQTAETWRMAYGSKPFMVKCSEVSSRESCV